MEVTLYTRQNCPLCDKAKDVLRGAGLTPKEVDVDLDLDLMRRLGNDVPVIYIDGVEAFRHRVTPEQLTSLMQRELSREWRVVDGHHLEREFRFKNFAEALAFTNKVGAIAEEQGHHPDIDLAWGRVRVKIWTHTVDGLTRSDFVLAAKIDRMASSS